MMWKAAPLGVLAFALAVPALAADTGVPPPGSVLYSPTPMVAAHVEMGIGAYGGPSSTSTLYTATGRANKVLGGGFNLQLEAGGATTVNGASANPLFGGYAHLWTMATPAAALGGFGGAAFTSGTQVTSVGVEGKTNVGAMSFTGMVSDNIVSNGGANYWLGSVGANLYLDPNQRIGAAATFAGAGGLTSSNAFMLTADVEKRFRDPISIWGSVNYVGSTSGGGNLWSVLAGLRIFADTPTSTLRSNEQTVPWHFTNPFRTY